MEPRQELTASDLRAAMASFRDGLRSHQQYLNALNVYPVPDGDTGTNMALTAESVVEELDQLGPDAGMSAVCKAIAHGSLMGARGNSGVILSQLLRGLTERFCEDVDGGVGPADLAAAFVAASELAYRAVVRPVEGTILTVARAAGEAAEARLGNGSTLVDVLSAARTGAAEAVARTPELLEALARAGVVDAGGSGYVLLFDGLLAVVDGRALPSSPVARARPGGAAGGPTMAGGGQEEVGDLRYEVMYLLHAPDDTIADFKEVWAGLGDSIVVVGGEGVWNCHIHTDDIGAAIEAALDCGRPQSIRVTDLHEQVEELRWVREGAAVPEVVPPAEPPATGVVAVVTGDGVGRIFRSLGVHHEVSGGQSHNPSTAELLAAVEAVGSRQVVILPNNDNIRPVAEQVDALTDVAVKVVPTGSIVEGFAALLAYDPAADAETNYRAMRSSAERVLAAEVTRAVRDADSEGGPVRAGQWIGLARQGILSVSDSLSEAACSLLERLVSGEHELVTLIEGEGSTAGDTRRITEWVGDRHPEVAVEVHHGGQPLYPYLIGIE